MANEKTKYKGYSSQILFLFNIYLYLLFSDTPNLVPCSNFTLQYK